MVLNMKVKYQEYKWKNLPPCCQAYNWSDTHLGRDWEHPTFCYVKFDKKNAYGEFNMDKALMEIGSEYAVRCIKEAQQEMDIVQQAIRTKAA